MDMVVPIRIQIDKTISTGGTVHINRDWIPIEGRLTYKTSFTICYQIEYRGRLFLDEINISSLRTCIRFPRYDGHCSHTISYTLSRRQLIFFNRWRCWVVICVGICYQPSPNYVNHHVTNVFWTRLYHLAWIITLPYV